LASISGSQAAPPSPAASPQPVPGRPRLLWVYAIGAAAVCALAALFVGWHAEHDQVDRAVVEALIVGVPVGVGFYAVHSPHDRRFGLILIASGLAWSLTALASSPDSLPYSIGRVSAWLLFPVLVYLMLAFPEGRLSSTTPRLLFASVTGLIVVLYIGSALFVDSFPAHTPWATCDADCPPNAFMVLDHQPAIMDDLVLPLRDMLGVLLSLGVTVLLVRRMRVSSPLRRRAIAPVVVVSLVWLLSLAAYLVVRWAAPGADAAETLARIWSLCVPGIAAAFLIGLLRRRIVLGEVLHFLGVTLSRPRDAPELRDALATALGDPRLEVLVPAGGGGWCGLDGRRPSLEGVAAGRQGVTVLGERDEPDMAIVHDAALDDDQELLDGVLALVRAWLEHERLEVWLATSRSQLADSRERIARVADAERSRIERDLHDGAQQRLIMLRIKLSLAEELLQRDAVAGAKAVHELGGEIDLAVEDLRALAHGVYPALLSDRGLGDALRAVVLDSPLPVHLQVADVTRHPVEIETAIYFVCLEAVQNAIKHARGATGLWIQLREEDALRAEIVDDGPGFTPGVEGNGGMRNMRDRIEAVGGRLAIDTTPGGGTLIRFSVPLVHVNGDGPARRGGLGVNGS
jgi:signal transduction histidine kinase